MVCNEHLAAGRIDRQVGWVVHPAGGSSQGLTGEVGLAEHQAGGLAVGEGSGGEQELGEQREYEQDTARADEGQQTTRHGGSFMQGKR
jgi:hypothetical protein